MADHDPPTVHPILTWARDRDVPLDTYATAVVTLATTPDEVRVVGLGLDASGRPASPAELLGARSVDVLTGWNPFSRERSRPENDRANERLARRLAEVLPGSTVVAATGASPDDSWSEPGFGVLDADPAVVIDLAREFGQHAIYRWTDEGWLLVATDLPDLPLPLPATTG